MIGQAEDFQFLIWTVHTRPEEDLTVGEPRRALATYALPRAEESSLVVLQGHPASRDG